MIYITGDVHGAISIGKRLNAKNFKDQKELTKKDFVIISGDFGLVWNLDKEDQYWLKWLEKQKTFTTLFIDGNHENFDLLENYQIEDWNGGKIRKINSSVFHLMRGQVFEIDNKKIFTFGGADSHDKTFRKEHISWWKQEMPSKEEYEEGLKNLQKHNWEVDYVITHTCSSGTLDRLCHQLNLSFAVDQLSAYFHKIEEKLKYKKWYFGHFHNDIELPKNQRLIFENIVKLED